MKTIKTFIESLIKYSVLAAAPLLVTFLVWVFTLGSFNFIEVINSEPLVIVSTILAVICVLISLIETGVKLSETR